MMSIFSKRPFFKVSKNHRQFYFPFLLILFFIGVYFPKSLQGQCCVIQAKLLIPPKNSQVTNPDSTTCSFFLEFTEGASTSYLIEPAIEYNHNNDKVGEDHDDGGVPYCCGNGSFYQGTIVNMSVSSLTPLPNWLTFSANENGSQATISGTPPILSSTSCYPPLPSPSPCPLPFPYSITINFTCEDNNNPDNLTSLSQDLFIIVVLSSSSSDVQKPKLVQNTLSPDRTILFSRTGREVKKNSINSQAQKKHFDYFKPFDWENVISFRSPKSQKGIKSFEIYDCSKHLKKPTLIATIPHNSSKKKYKLRHSIKGPCLSYKYKIITRMLWEYVSEPVVLKIDKL